MPETEEKEQKQETFQLEPLDDVFAIEPAQKTEESRPAEAKDEKPEGDESDKGDIEPSQEKAEADEAKTGDAKASEEKAESEGKAEAVAEEKSGIDWDSTDNPYKKRYEDTRNWSTRVNQEKVELDKKLDILSKKIDGTWDEDAEKANEPTPEQVKAEGEAQGRIMASEELARETYGSDVVDSVLNEFHEQYRDNQAIQSRVLLAKAPIMEAMKVMKEAKFMAIHGTDPEKIEASIKSKYEAELTKSITEKVTKEISDRFTKKGEQLQGLSEVTGSASQEKPDQLTVEPLSELFK